MSARKNRVAARKKPPHITSLRSLAKALGKSHTAVQKVARREDWPFRPPFALQQVKQWWSDNADSPGAPDPTDAPHAVPGTNAPDPAAAIRNLGPEKQLKLKYLAARIRKLETDHKQLLRTLIPRDDVERDRLARVMAVKNELMNTPRLMAMLASAASPVEQEEKIRQWCKGICDRFAGDPPAGSTAPSAITEPDDADIAADDLETGSP